MKILFVCKGNNCRSQMAEAIYNRLMSSDDASSAGTRVEGAGETLEQFGNRPGITSFTLNVMQDAGYDLKSKRQVQLTKDMLTQYDMVVNMAAKRYTPNVASRCAQLCALGGKRSRGQELCNNEECQI